jgi:hypothetical protein
VEAVLVFASTQRALRADLIAEVQVDLDMRGAEGP